jgi:hypothetical protein
VDPATTANLVLITWEDSATEHGWQFDKEVTLTPTPCQSIGWVIRETDDYIVLAGCVSQLSDEVKPSNNRRLVIPKKNILSTIEIMEHKHK